MRIFRLNENRVCVQSGSGNMQQLIGELMGATDCTADSLGLLLVALSGAGTEVH